MLTLLAAALLTQVDSPPPLISAEVEVAAPAPTLPLPPPPAQPNAEVPVASPPPVVQAPAPTPAVKADPDEPLFELSALATGSLVTSTEGAQYTVGARAELDVFRVSAMFSYERALSSTFTFSDTQQFMGLIGYSLINSPWVKLRLSGGVNALASASQVTPAPVFGTSARVGFHFLSLEASATLTPAVFRELDTRAALVLRAALFEVQAGYRAKLTDTTSTGSLGTLFSNQLSSGPFVAIGFSL